MLCITVGDVVVEEYVDVLLLVIVPLFRSIASINRSFSVNVCLGESLVLRVACLGFKSVVIFPQLLSLCIGVSSIAVEGCAGILALYIPVLPVLWSFVSWCVLYSFSMSLILFLVCIISSINWLVFGFGTVGSCRLLFEGGLFCILHWVVLSGVVMFVLVFPTADMISVFGEVSAVDN